jgi:hypothetical protein
MDRLQALVRFRSIGAAVQRAQARVYHATETNGLVLVPGIRTLATLYDLIPLHYPSAIFPLCQLDLRAMLLDTPTSLSSRATCPTRTW